MLENAPINNCLVKNILLDYIENRKIYAKRREYTMCFIFINNSFEIFFSIP